MKQRPALAAFAGIFVVTMLGLLAVGATLPVLPRYVKGPIGSTDLAVGWVSGAFAFTGLAFRPLAGHFADARGRRLTVIIGALLSALAGVLYFVPAGVPGLIVARLVLGAGEGMVFTAGSAWVVDLAPPERRGRMIGLYGLAIWSGLSLGPPIGELLLRASSFETVWAFAAAAPLLGAVIATRIPERFTRRAPTQKRAPLLAREAVRPGLTLSLGVVGFAAVAAFLVLHLEQEGLGHGAETFAAFAATVVLVRLIGGDLPDRVGPVPCAIGSALLEAVGLALIGLASSVPMAIAGAMIMGGAYSTLYPALALLVVERVGEDRRGVGLGTFTASFDIGVGLGSPLLGAIAAAGGYSAAFYGAAVCALLAAAVAAFALPRGDPMTPPPGAGPARVPI
ncbi:MAG: MFS transporter [Solirubrobacterales bacterium]